MSGEEITWIDVLEKASKGTPIFVPLEIKDKFPIEGKWTKKAEK